MTITTEQVLEHIRKQKDVGYYNKEIIKKKQRNNKDIAEEELVASPLSFGLVADAPKVNPEVVVLPEEEGGSPDPNLNQNQAPTSPPAHLTSTQIKRAMIQFYDNQLGSKLQKRKLKIRLNCDFGEGKEENVEFIATLTQDLGNFKQYHPESSREYIQAWTMDSRSQIRKEFDVKPYMGKFHENNGWRKQGSQVNQIEPWTGCLLWYDKSSRSYRCLIKIYQWEELFELSDDSVTDKQRKTNLKAQKLWHNPEHLNLVRPKTWAEKRGLE